MRDLVSANYPLKAFAQFQPKENLMEVIKLIVSVIDFERLGAQEVAQTIENANFPNDCISPDVRSVEVRDIGAWSDEHPLNHAHTAAAEFNRLFDSPAKPQDASVELAKLRNLLAEANAKVIELTGEHKVFADVIDDAWKVITTVEGENTDENERLHALQERMERLSLHARGVASANG